MEAVLPEYMRVSFSVFMVSPSTGLSIEYKLEDCKEIHLGPDPLALALRTASQELNRMTKKNDARPMTGDEVTQFVAMLKKQAKEAAMGKHNESDTPRNLLS